MAFTNGSPLAQGRALFETSCAPCHGPTGAGGYLAPSARPPRNAGVATSKILHQVRQGGDAMPAFSSAVLADADLQNLAAYVHETLAPSGVEPGRIGPRALDPIVVGAIVFGALALFSWGLSALFGEGRN